MRFRIQGLMSQLHCASSWVIGNGAGGKGGDLGGIGPPPGLGPPGGTDARRHSGVAQQGMRQLQLSVEHRNNQVDTLSTELHQERQRRKALEEVLKRLLPDDRLCTEFGTRGRKV